LYFSIAEPILNSSLEMPGVTPESVDGKNNNNNSSPTTSLKRKRETPEENETTIAETEKKKLSLNDNQGQRMPLEEVYSLGLKDMKAATREFINRIEDLPTFVQLLWDKAHVEEKLPSNRNKLPDILFQWWNVLLLSGRTLQQEPLSHDEYDQLLKQQTEGSRACGSVFQEGDMVINCKNCQMDPTSAICMSCFLNSNDAHKDHNYTIHKTGGGVCDCGEPQAWKTSGFCTRHPGTKLDLQPDELLPSITVQSSQSTIRAVLKILSDLVYRFVKLEDREEDEDNESEDAIIRTEHWDLVGERIAIGDKIHVIVQWLFGIVERGDAFKNIIARELGEPSTDIADEEDDELILTPLDILISTHNIFPNYLRVYLHRFYFKLVADYTFKRIFLSHYARYYPSLIRDALAKERRSGFRSLGSDDLGSLLDLSVQLFTVSIFVLDMICRSQDDDNNAHKKKKSLVDHSDLYRGYFGICLN